MTTCVFCEILIGQQPATVLRQWSNAIAIEPLNPVTPGHALIIPRAHVRDFTESPAICADTFHRAAEYAEQQHIFPANLLTSAGREATQTIFHLHVHVIPRRDGDGLTLPWTAPTEES